MTIEKVQRTKITSLSYTPKSETNRVELWLNCLKNIVRVSADILFKNANSRLVLVFSFTPILRAMWSFSPVAKRPRPEHEGLHPRTVEDTNEWSYKPTTDYPDGTVFN
jgi:hypothetical protein